MEYSPSRDANSFSASQEIPRILWNTKVHSSIQKSPLLVPVLSQIKVYVALSDFQKTHFNNILPSTPLSPKWFLSLRFPHQNPVYSSPFPMRATSPAHLPLLDVITRIILCDVSKLIPIVSPKKTAYISLYWTRILSFVA